MFVMGHSLAASHGRTPAVASAPSLRQALSDLWRTLREFGGSYHPERHYMRGPGPKWHAKHGHSDSLTAHDIGLNGLTTA
jgi:hypothetical protein